MSLPASRRRFLQASGAGAAALALGQLVPVPARAAEEAVEPMTAAKTLFESLTDAQRGDVCFEWDYVDPGRGVLRRHVSNNWSITKPVVNSRYFTDDQRDLIKQIFERTYHPDWHARIYQQLKDDAGGFGNNQSIAFFGKPGEKFEFVMTGRHMTMRCDGNSAEHVAFGGPVFYGHDPHGEFYEGPNHDDNVYWEQALIANKLYEMLDGTQRQAAEVAKTPAEGDAAFKGDQPIAGIAVRELSADQKEHVQKVLTKLLEPYREVDREEVRACLKSQGGLDACHLAFYKDGDISDDRVWDNWRLEGPAFVWHYRGNPHVHVWVSIADDPGVPLVTPFTVGGGRRRG